MRRSPWPLALLCFTVSCAEKSNRLDIRTSFYVFSRINQSLAKQEAPRKARHTGTGAYLLCECHTVQKSRSPKWSAGDGQQATQCDAKAQRAPHDSSQAESAIAIASLCAGVSSKVKRSAPSPARSRLSALRPSIPPPHPGANTPSCCPQLSLGLGVAMQAPRRRPATPVGQRWAHPTRRL